jgi:hypothetical protein
MATRDSSIKEITNSFFWIVGLQGLSLIVLGALIIIYPAVLFLIVAAAFIWTGLTTLMLAWRVRQSRDVLHQVLV